MPNITLLTAAGPFILGQNIWLQPSWGHEFMANMQDVTGLGVTCLAFTGTICHSSVGSTHWLYAL